MLDTVIPSIFIYWFRSFFNDRRTRVQLFNVFSPSRLLLRVYLKAHFSPRYSSCFTSTIQLPRLMTMLLMTIAPFPEDVSILITTRKKEDAKAASQSIVNSVVTWSQEWKLNLNADKIEVCPFSILSHDSIWEPGLFIGTQKIRVNITPRLLGVILDRSLKFNAHLKKLTTSLSSSLRIIRATAHISWA